MRQSTPSSVMLRSVAWIPGCALSNTQRFLCFHEHHTTKMIMEFSPFRHSFGTRRCARLHQSWKVSSCVGASAWKPADWRAWNHTCRETTHCMRMCWMLSCSWSQNGQDSWCCSPLLASLSAVQHRSAQASHRKSLARIGAHVCQRRLHGSKVVVPVKKVRYAEREEKLPDPWNLHRCMSA